MKKGLLIAAAGFQALVLAFLAGEREHVVRTGRTVFLRTAPVDPRDLFRGDYVTLDYAATTVPAPLWQDGLAGGRETFRKGQRVYAGLETDEDNLAHVLYLTDVRP